MSRCPAHAPSAVRLLALGLFSSLTLLAPGAAAAQTVTGTALGPDGEPLAQIPVVFHRVGGGGGAFVATDTSGADGQFRFALEPADSGLYFAAIRYEGRLYIGPAIRAGGEPVTGYTLRVDPANEAGAVASALSGQTGSAGPLPRGGRAAGSTRGGEASAGSDPGAYLLVGLLAFGAAAAFYLAAPRYRRRRRRDALVELATVENTLAVESPDDRARLEATRDRLRKQLAPEA